MPSIRVEPYFGESGLTYWLNQYAQAADLFRERQAPGQEAANLVLGQETSIRKREYNLPNRAVWEK